MELSYLTGTKIFTLGAAPQIVHTSDPVENVGFRVLYTSDPLRNVPLVIAPIDDGQSLRIFLLDDNFRHTREFFLINLASAALRDSMMLCFVAMGCTLFQKQPDL